MKKNISLFLTLVMLMLTVPVTAQKTSENSLEKKGLLLKLGIFAEEDFQEADGVVTRGEFAVYAARMLSLDTDEYINKRYFKDVPASRREAGAVNALNERGIMVGVGDYEFLIDEPIKTEHAASVLQRIAGYPKDYLLMDMTVKAEIMSGVKSTVIDENQAVVMIYNTLMVPYLSMTGVSNGNVMYDTEEDYLVLEELFDVYCVEGRLTGAEGVSIKDNKTLAKNTVSIEDEIFESECDDAYKYLGMYVDAYIRNDKNGAGTLLFVVDDTEDVITIQATDIISVDKDKKITYAEGENRKEKHVNLPQNVRVIKNGGLLKDNVLEALDIKSGYMQIIENDKGVYDVVKISEFKASMVSVADTENNAIYLKNSEVLNLSESGLKRINIYNSNGDEIAVSDLKSGNFISYFKSDVSLEIYVSDNILNGIIESVNDNGERILVSISGNESYVNPDYYNENKDKFQIGTNGIYYADFDGNIAYAVLNNDGKNFGCVINANISEDTDNLRLKIYTQNGTVELLEVTSGKVEVDGKVMNSKDALDSILKNCPLGGIIRYTVNNNGALVEVDTAYFNKDYESEYSLRQIVSAKKLVYLPTSKSFGVILPTDSNTVIMQIPKEDGEVSTNEKDYAINPKFVGYDPYVVDGYTTNPDSIFPDVIVTGAVSGEESWCYLVDSVSDALNKDGELVKTVRVGGREGISQINVADTFEVTEADRISGYVSYDDISEGDIIKINQNGRGEILKIKLVFDYDKDKAIDTSRLNAYGSYEKWDNENCGYVKKVQNSYYKFGSLESDENDSIMPLTTSAIIVYDSKRRADEIYIGTEKDIKSVEDVGDDASYIITNQKNGISQLTIVYKNGADMFKGE